jgi:hypothetical protein
MDSVALLMTMKVSTTTAWRERERMADLGGKSAHRRSEPGGLSQQGLPRQTADGGDRTETPEPGRLRQLWARIQRLAGYGVMHASSPLRHTAGSGEPVRARARLQSAWIEERYRYHRDISLNPSIKITEEPEGRFQLTLPYDGDSSFTRQAHRDVARSRDAGSDSQALVGFLVFSGYEQTNLDSLSDLWETPGSIPIQVPLPPPPGPDEPDPLLTDKSACVVSHDYRPGQPARRLAPVHIDLALEDPDTTEFSIPVSRGEPGLARVRIKRHVEFKPGLSLRMTVRLHVPRRLAHGANPEVSEVFIGWPTHTSLSSLELRIGGKAHPLRYNPEWENPDSREDKKERGLEWFGIPMILEPEPIGGDIRTFRSPNMIVSIPKAGELYWQESLSGRVEVRINRLLSGTDARLYDTTGKLSRRPALEKDSVISTTFSLNLDDAFASRTLSPYQQIYFGEVIPSSMRIDDIITALRNRGFTVDDPPPDLDPQSYWIKAKRIQGPNRLSLELYVEGRSYKALRQRDVPGGLTYRTHVDSGELRIYVYGFLAGKSQPVVQEVNALRLALRERFNRLPAWR